MHVPAVLLALRHVALLAHIHTALTVGQVLANIHIALTVGQVHLHPVQLYLVQL